MRVLRGPDETRDKTTGHTAFERSELTLPGADDTVAAWHQRRRAVFRADYGEHPCAVKLIVHDREALGPKLASLGPTALCRHALHALEIAEDDGQPKDAPCVLPGFREVGVLRHPFLTRVFGCNALLSGAVTAVVSEWLPDTLRDAWARNNFSRDRRSNAHAAANARARTLVAARQLGTALEHVHTRQLAHGHVHCSNVHLAKESVHFDLTDDAGKSPADVATKFSVTLADPGPFGAAPMAGENSDKSSGRGSSGGGGTSTSTGGGASMFSLKAPTMFALKAPSMVVGSSPATAEAASRSGTRCASVELSPQKEAADVAALGHILWRIYHGEAHASGAVGAPTAAGVEALPPDIRRIVAGCRAQGKAAWTASVVAKYAAEALPALLEEVKQGGSAGGGGCAPPTPRGKSVGAGFSTARRVVVPGKQPRAASVEMASSVGAKEREKKGGEWTEAFDPVHKTKYWIHNTGDRRSSWTPHDTAGDTGV